MRMLGLIMMVAGFIICVSAYYIIKVGGFPANLVWTCGFWGSVCLIGFIIFVANLAKGSVPPDAYGMRLDVRLPIGVMFVLFGAMLAIYGLVSDPAIYERSLGININLWWGLVMFAFGAFMLIMAIKASKKP